MNRPDRARQKESKRYTWSEACKESEIKSTNFSEIEGEVERERDRERERERERDRLRDREREREREREVER